MTAYTNRTVTDQAGLDKAIADGVQEIDIRSEPDVLLEVREHGASRVRAFDSSSVAAYGSSHVTAFGASTVSAFDSSNVGAHDSSTVTVFDTSTVGAFDSSTVTAYESSTVAAFDSSRVSAFDSATAKAYGRATVTTRGSSTVTKPPSSDETLDRDLPREELKRIILSLLTVWGVGCNNGDIDGIIENIRMSEEPNPIRSECVRFERSTHAEALGADA